MHLHFKEFFYNDSLPCVLRNVFLYDIRSCFPRILSKFGIYVPESDNKMDRMVFIGNLFKTNKQLLNLCLDSTNQIINNFIAEHEIDYDEIIAIERDGLMIKKFIPKLSGYDIEPELKEKYDLVIRHYSKRNVFLMIKNNKVILKGVPHKTLGIEDFMSSYFQNVNDIDDRFCLKMLNKMRSEYFKTNNWKLFAIPNNGKFVFKLEGGRDVAIEDPENSPIDLGTLNYNRYFYFKEHIEGFVQSLINDIL